MSKKSVLEEVIDRMNDLQQKKTEELDTVHQRQQEAQTQKEAAELALKDATDRMDLDAYEEAKAARRKAQAAIDMYSSKYKQISQQEYISEADSDKVIDSLLEYENKLAGDFNHAISIHLSELRTILLEYVNEVEKVENTITAWTEKIHANYRSAGTIYPDGSNRSKTPVPVRRMPYTGCDKAHKLEDFLKEDYPLWL